MRGKHRQSDWDYLLKRSALPENDPAQEFRPLNSSGNTCIIFFSYHHLIFQEGIDGGQFRRFVGDAA